jgi:hypothetical protein
MKTLKMIVIATAFIVLPISDGLRAQETSTQAPPIEQTLIREGDFALKLVERLRIGTPQSEAEAETMLSSTGISPQNGWISDYPVTPDIIGELQEAVGDAADADRLLMGRDEALKTLQDLAAEVGLSVEADGRTVIPSGEPSGTHPHYSESAVTDYYHTYGPPIVTYYPPPWPYLYLYAWVPYPFWWTEVYFPGFYVLTNFHRRIYIHHRPVYISNHWRDPKTRRVFVIDPSRRHTREFMRRGIFGSPKGFTSPEARRGAASILRRSRGHMTPQSRGAGRPGGSPASRNPISSRPGAVIERQSSNQRLGNLSSHSGKPPQVRGSIGNQRTSRPSVKEGFRKTEGRVSSGFGRVDRPREPISPRERGNQSRAYGRATNDLPRRGKVNSFTSPNLGNRGSFGRTYGGTTRFGFGRGGR